MVKNIPVVLLIFCISIISCSSSDKQENSGQPLPKESSVELKEITRISNINDEIYFSGFRKLLVTSEGGAILNDYRQQALFYFDEEGNFIDQIGQEGPGPNEFRDIRNLVLAPGDTIHTFDRNNARHQVLTPTESTWKQVRELKLEQGFSEDLHAFYPEKLYPRDENTYWALFKNNIGLRDTTTMYHEWFIPVDANLEPITDKKRQVSPSEMAIINRRDNFVISSTHPNSYKVFTEFDADQQLVHRAYNTNASIRVMDLEGNAKNHIQLPYETITPDPDEKQEYLNNLRENNSFDNQAVETAEDAYLDHMAYIQQFVMDDQNRYWIKVPRGSEENPNWIIVSSDGEMLGSFRIQDTIESLENFTLSYVSDNRLYGYGYIKEEPVFLIFEAANLQDIS